MFYAIIPARSGSKSIKDKNIQILNGEPLIAHSISVAKSIPEIKRVIVSTDSQLYAGIAKGYGAEILSLRPKEISGDSSWDIDWILDLLSQLDDIPKYLIHLRPTSPLRDLKYIVKAMQYIQLHNDATALISVHPLSIPSHKFFELDGKYIKSAKTGVFDLDLCNGPRQGYVDTYVPNGYVDILKTEYILANHKIHGDKVLAFKTPKITDIDTMEDLELVRHEK